uniref:Uncharacterized protein n=1 Tax=Anguilla anguilla TaxID=7936 RepID=A0A0E9QN33_ANGAN
MTAVNRSPKENKTILGIGFFATFHFSNPCFCTVRALLKMEDVIFETLRT